MKKFFVFVELYDGAGDLLEVEALDAKGAVRGCAAIWQTLDEEARAEEEAEVTVLVSEGPDFPEPVEIFVASSELEIIRDVMKVTKSPADKARLLRIAQGG